MIMEVFDYSFLVITTFGHALTVTKVSLWTCMMYKYNAYMVVLSDELFVFTQIGANIKTILEEKTFLEPHLIIFTDDIFEGCIVSEKKKVLKFEDFSVLDGFITLLAIYYAYDVKFPKSLPAQSFLLFIQEVLLGCKDMHARHSAKYKMFANKLFEQ